MKSLFLRIVGVQNHTSLAEKLVSMSGACLGIAMVFYVGRQFTGYQGALAILPSMGAAAVLLFAMPHGPLSQPWALFGGNLLSALVGVSCAALFDNTVWAASAAVALAIVLMHIARCIHPPGGATALAAVIGGPEIHALGYGYVLVPTLLNCTVLFVMAVVFNYRLSWRRYPAGLMAYTPTARADMASPSLQVRHIEKAMENMDVLIDVSAEQIKRVLDSAHCLLRDERIHHLQVELGAFYTNARPGMGWAVRQVIDEKPDDDPARHMLIYRTVDGSNRSSTGSCSLEEFAEWAKEKMQPVPRSKRESQ